MEVQEKDTQASLSKVEKGYVKSLNFVSRNDKNRTAIKLYKTIKFYFN